METLRDWSAFAMTVAAFALGWWRLRSIRQDVASKLQDLRQVAKAGHTARAAKSVDELILVMKASPQETLVAALRMDDLRHQLTQLRVGASDEDAKRFEAAVQQLVLMSGQVADAGFNRRLSMQRLAKIRDLLTEIEASAISPGGS